LLYLLRASRVPDAAGTQRIPGIAGETKTCVLIQTSGTDVVRMQQLPCCTVSAHSWNALPKIDSTSEA
jgi:hypothetical protein